MEWKQNPNIKTLSAGGLEFQPVNVDIPPIPMLAHGLDRVLFNPGTYRLQDPRSRIYNFDPYLEEIMPVNEFDFEALSEYQTSSKDPKLLAITRQTGAKFTGSTSSMSGVLQHFHYLLSANRGLNLGKVSRGFGRISTRFTRITTAPQAIFLRWKDGMYAIDADKSFDSPNVMSWLGHSMEKLLTNTPEDFEKYRRSNPEQAPSEVESGKSYHYTRIGNFLLRSQLDAQDPRLPGTGVFDLKTRAVLPIRMDHTQPDKGIGYQLRFDHGEWESFEREDYDMARATMLKYSLQVRMGRMDGIFVAYHNTKSIFGFRYISRADMDFLLHGQQDTCLGDQEFNLSITLLDEILQRATAKYPETSIRLHFETTTEEHDPAVMKVFAEPVTEEQIEEIQSKAVSAMNEFEEQYVKGNVKEAVQDLIDELNRDELLEAEEGGEESGIISGAENTEEDVDQGLVDDPNKDELDEAEESGIISGAENTEEDVDQERVGNPNKDDAPQSNSGPDDDALPTTDDSMPRGPLAGWSLACRSSVNGERVKRPMDISPTDDYSIEYLLQDLPQGDSLYVDYTLLKKRRALLFDRSIAKEVASFQVYRLEIAKYTQRGKAWKEEQDKLDEQMGIGKQLYRPLGPGAEKVL
ncbi:Pet127-domain-containing protein [Pleomassaria siparia CBS 279.74]|uniref:Pet127-domain-containing protein n=1 Tax=Pleomassaria siparia CBS 279.74 TaxID=1314801 RepID=A0A6G1KQT6_9PLEO|nr:Pet127-domain-containing protein [Pleomassaria siparia CBS 279.74]